MRTIDTIVLHHTASNYLAQTWEDIRRYHKVTNGWSDIGYHAGIVYDSGDWAIAIGRPTEKIGAHVKGHNTNSFGLAFEGNFEHDAVSREQVDLGLEVIMGWVRKYDISPDRIFGHRELAPTLCPGRFFPLNEIRGRIKDQLFKEAV